MNKNRARHFKLNEEMIDLEKDLHERFPSIPYVRLYSAALRLLLKLEKEGAVPKEIWKPKGEDSHESDI